MKSMQLIIKPPRIAFLGFIMFVYAPAMSQTAESIPTTVLNFYGDSATVNPRAPIETRQFGQLKGIWYCTQYNKDSVSGEFKVFSKAYWAWKYILDGYGVQDFWFQGENEIPYYKYFKRNMMLTQIRVYDTEEKLWKIAYINNNAGEIPGSMFGRFTAKGEGDEVTMYFEPNDAEILRRIIFYDVTDESFQWRVEVSNDLGKSWEVTWKIEGTKLL